MREDCRHFESRTYGDDGEVARFCTLDLAPEAPWRCPEPCARYELSVIDGTFVTGPLTHPSVEDEPEGSSDDIVAVLEDAEAIVDCAEPDAIRDTERAQASAGPRKRWQPWKRRGAGGDDDDFRLSNR